jgi:hypothetical protein
MNIILKTQQHKACYMSCNSTNRYKGRQHRAIKTTKQYHGYKTIYNKKSIAEAS